MGISQTPRRVECRHREGAGTIGVDERGRADAVAAHERPQPREQCRERVGRQRAREESELQHAPFGDVYPDGYAIDRRRRRVRLEIEQCQGAQHARVAHRRRQLDHTLVPLACELESQDSIRACAREVSRLGRPLDRVNTVRVEIEQLQKELLERF